ncbi:MAG: hypothetical protein RhofKO_42560 [Rhodothermales bacterium]
MVALTRSSSETQVRYDEAGLGVGTVSTFADANGVPIHCQDFTLGHFAPAGRCLEVAATRPEATEVLWLGNSQLHGLNQPQEGDSTAVARFDAWLRARGHYSVTLSQPNANLQEHYVLFELVREQLPLRLVLLPAVFDDTRETGLRSAVLNGLGESSARQALSVTDIGRQILAEAPDLESKAAADGGVVDLAALDHTVQERTERWLNARLERHVPLWANRPNARGEIFSTLYKARNTLLAIDPSTKRPMIPSRYAANMDALRALLASAAVHDIRVLVYIAPIRSDVPIPYISDEYAQFKHEIEQVAAEHGAAFANLEGIVPGPFWGTKEATRLGGGPEYDFMHFQDEGHRRLAHALTTEIESHRLLAPTMR